jgi:hypothetical protein
MYAKVALTLALFQLALCGPWMGRYTVESGCNIQTCCCPTPGTQFDILENRGIAFTTAVTGACNGVPQITFTAQFNPNDRTYRGKVTGYGGITFNTNIVRTRTGFNFVNTDYAICSFSAWAANAPTRVPSALWVGNYIVDKRCDSNQCCCPTNGASVSVPWAKQLNIAATNSGKWCPSGTYSVQIQGQVDGNQVFNGEVTPVMSGPRGPVRVWRTGYGITVENMTNPACTYALLEP